MLASASPSSAAPSASGAYARREPENTVLHRIVREHLETFLATVREERGKGLPRYVEEELRRYLRCGILAHGFLRVVCSKWRRDWRCHVRAAVQLDARVFCPFSRPGARWGLPRGRRRSRRVPRRPRAHACRHRGRRGARGEAHVSLAAPPRPSRRTRSRRPLERSARALSARSVHADVPLRKHLCTPRERWRASAAHERGGSVSRSGQRPVGRESVGAGARWGDFPVVSTSARSAREGSRAAGSALLGLASRRDCH